MSKADRAKIMTYLVGYVKAKWLTPRQACLLTKYYGVI